jgi:hypothetical protein
MKRCLLMFFGAVLAVALLSTVPATADATQTVSLWIDVSGGALSWSGNVLTGKDFSFTRIVGYDENGDVTGTYTLGTGVAGNVSFVTSGTPASAISYNGAGKNSVGTVSTVFSGGAISVSAGSGSGSEVLISGSFDPASGSPLTATTSWGKSKTYSGGSILQGEFTFANVDSALMSYFDIARDASGSFDLFQWRFSGATSLSPQSILSGKNIDGSVSVQAQSVPVPVAVLLFAPGLLGLIGFRKRVER